MAAADCDGIGYYLDGRQEREAAAGRTFCARDGAEVPEALGEERRLLEEEQKLVLGTGEGERGIRGALREGHDLGQALANGSLAALEAGGGTPETAIELAEGAKLAQMLLTLDAAIGEETLARSEGAASLCELCGGDPELRLHPAQRGAPRLR